MKRMLLTLTALILLASTASARDTWLDDFDSYAPGPLVGQSEWEAWQFDLSFDALVVSGPARSLPNSVEILPTSDVVAVFSGATSGQWTVSGWSFIPCNSTGGQWWIMLNTYDVPNNSYHWSLQVNLDSDSGLVRDMDGSATLPLICDQWVELRAEIDLDGNSQTVYYDNQVLFTDSWTEHWSPGGALQIGCLDLWGEGFGSSGFWDDILVEGPVVIPTEHTSWGKVKNLYR